MTEQKSRKVKLVFCKITVSNGLVSFKQEIKQGKELNQLSFDEIERIQEELALRPDILWAQYFVEEEDEECSSGDNDLLYNPIYQQATPRII